MKPAFPFLLVLAALVLAPSPAAAQRDKSPTVRKPGALPASTAPAAAPAPKASPAAPAAVQPAPSPSPAAPVAVRPAPPPASRPVAAPLPLDARIKPIAADPGYKVLKRPPIAFRPFAPSDLGPGATPERMVSIPGSGSNPGRSIPVATYLSQINAIEQRLNEIGYSLRDMGDTPETATLIVEPTIGRADLTRQATTLSSRHLRRGNTPGIDQATTTFRARVPRLDATSAAARRTSLVDALQEVAVAPGVLGGSSAQNGVFKDWGLPVGDPNSFWVSLDGRFLLDGNAAGTTMEVTQRARASVLRNDLELLRLTGELQSPVSGAMTASLEFRVLGNTVSVFNESPATFWTVDGRQGLAVGWGLTDPFNVGGVPMRVEFDVRGEAGVQYYATVGPGSATGVIVPFANADAFAEIDAIDVDVVEAGVRGELVIVRDNLVLAGSASIQYDNAAAQPYLYFDYLGVNDFEALNGNLHLYACAYVISNWQPKKKCWKKYFWKEDGIDLHDTLLEGSEKVYLD